MTETCQRCLNTGYLGFKTYPNYELADCEFCECESGQALMARIREKERLKSASDYDSRLDRAGIPVRFHKFTLDTFEAVFTTDSQKTALAWAKMLANGGIKGATETRRSVYLYSIDKPDADGYGVGKTALCTAIMMEWLMQGKECLWYEAGGMIAHVRGGYADSTATTRIEKIQRADGLIIDDIGEVWQDQANKNYIDILTGIVTYRHNWMLPTLVTSNLSLQTIARQFSKKISHRLNELCAVLEIVGTDMRRKGGKA